MRDPSPSAPSDGKCHMPNIIWALVTLSAFGFGVCYGLYLAFRESE